MVRIAEVVVELVAEGFTNSGKKTRGRVLRDSQPQPYTVTVDDEVKGVDAPTARYSSIEEARYAIEKYWASCEEELKRSGTPCWKP